MIDDTYVDFAALASNEMFDRDYTFRVQRRDSGTIVIAPHGGGIEPGTSEVAEAIAGTEHSFYAFEGIKASGNRVLHITGTRFDEPQGLGLVRASRTAVAIHGEDSEGETIMLGGRNHELLEKVGLSLTSRGFPVQCGTKPGLEGSHVNNICNRTDTGEGIQIELSNGLRVTFFESLTRNGRTAPTTRFAEFVAAVREALRTGQ